jgi:serine phosphatase RsbU (regulator of sigma subunit)
MIAETTRIQLEEGDVVLFCSDGVHECADRDGGEFGPARPAELLTRNTGAASRSASLSS